jgi:hypothetical protein
MIRPALIAATLALAACGDECPAGQEKVRRPARIEPVSDRQEDGVIYHRAAWECRVPTEKEPGQ